MKRVCSIISSVLCALALAACSSGGGGSADAGAATPTEVIVPLEGGVVFRTGEILTMPAFNRVDLQVTENGDHPRLQTGGGTSAKNEPANWFSGGGGIPQVFSSLDEVPLEKPMDGSGSPLLSAKTGNGFVIKNFKSGGYTRGWIRKVSANAVTIEFEVVD